MPKIKIELDTRHVGSTEITVDGERIEGELDSVLFFQRAGDWPICRLEYSEHTAPEEKRDGWDLHIGPKCSQRRSASPHS